VSGDALPYLDATLALAIGEAQNGSIVERRGGLLYVRVPAGARAAERQAVIEAWYKEQAQSVFLERVEHFAPIAAVTPGGVAVRSQKARWGSCGRHGTLYFNWRLLLAPQAVLDYLVVHELCHLRQRGHGPRFWRLVERVLPDFEKREATLRRDGWRYRLSGR
jgi:predicted metal-dependent hydrolase